MAEERPDPDQLLARVREEEARVGRGHLKVFFGYAAGVGKTYAMLEAARREKAQGIDIVVGYVEPHGRVETESLLNGLEIVPMRAIPYQGVQVREFDLDAALKRHPQLILVDELAHTNAEGSRHSKRWQDIEELLEAGIDVWTTLNVQHLESLNDVIAQITGIVVRETIPDTVIERADELELVDLTPDELMERLQAGKVYIPHQAERALQSFFQKSNLVALRELSLRETADRLQKDVDSARKSKSTQVPWATRERLLVCVGPSPTSARLIRTTKRLADGLNGEWLAVAVNTPTTGDMQTSVARHLGLAERLGAETHTLAGPNIAAALLELARERNVTKIIVGKTDRPWWKKLIKRGVVEELLDGSGDIDIYVIRGRADGSGPKPVATPKPITWNHYFISMIVIAICNALGWASFSFHLAEANIAMIYLLGVVVVATRFGRGPAAFTAVVNVLTFDFFFVPPYFTFVVNDAQYIITFAIMLGVGLLVSALTIRVRERLIAVQNQERRTSALYRLTKQLSELVGTEFIVQTAGRQLGDLFRGEVTVSLGPTGKPLEIRFGQTTEIAKLPINGIVAQWVAEHDQAAGLGTDTLPNATALFVPLRGSQRVVGALGVRPREAGLLADPEQRRLLETCASLIALSIERDQSVLEAQQSEVRAEAEQMRSSLLSSVSHDLRTPLAAITGAASTLMNEFNNHELFKTIYDESRRLTRLTENLLEITRLESGATLNRQWHVLEEIVGSAIGRVRSELGQRKIDVEIPNGFPLIFVDDILLEQVFINILENANRYAPDGPLRIAASRTNDRIVIRFLDTGPGIPAGMEEKIFEKFFRGTKHSPDSRRGIGLGLAICRSAILAHGGTISASNRPEGGAEFKISLPLLNPPA